jgi:hypothetical protein
MDRGKVIMERKLKAALLTTISDYNAITKQIHNSHEMPSRRLQLIAAQEALNRVLRHFADAEYVEYVAGQWQIKVIVVESTLSVPCNRVKE